MKKWKRERDEQRKRQHEVRRYYNYALMRPANEDKPTVLHVKDEHGETTLLDKKADIYNKEVEVTRAHMGKGRERWYINGKETFPLFEDSEEGKKCEDKYKTAHYRRQNGKRFHQRCEGSYDVRKHASRNSLARR